MHAGHGLRRLRPAAVPVAQSHNLEMPGVHAGELDGGLVRLGAAVGEIGFADFPGRDLRQLLRQRDDGFIGQHGRSVLDFVNLRLDLVVTRGFECPTEMVTMPPKKSRYFLPSVSHRYCMLAWSVASGSEK